MTSTPNPNEGGPSGLPPDRNPTGTCDDSAVSDGPLFNKGRRCETEPRFLQHHPRCRGGGNAPFNPFGEHAECDWRQSLSYSAGIRSRLSRASTEWRNRLRSRVRKTLEGFHPNVSEY